MEKLKIYKAFHAYQSYLDYFYDKNPELKAATFQKQQDALIYDVFPWIFSWITNINDDSIEIFETVHNCEWLQKAWDKKVDIKDNWQIEIVLNQIKKIQPDICFLYPPELFKSSILEEIRNSVQHDLLILGYDGMHRKNEELYKGYDLIITCSDYISEYYKQKGFQTYSLEFGFDEKILNKIDTKNKSDFNIGYSGSIYLNENKARYEILKYLTRRTNVAIRSEFDLYKNSNLISKSQIKLFLREWNLSKNLALWRIGKMNNGPVYGLEMYQFLQRSKISLNVHGYTIDFSANARMYEITGVGSCMLTDLKKNTGEIFEIDKEIVTYQTLDEAYDKIKFLLKNDRIRNKIAQAGQKRTLQNYTYQKRFNDLLTFLKKEILNFSS